MTTTRVFVYGTLKPGGRYHREFCDRHLTDLQAAIAPGLLYDFPQLGYPGMTPGDGWVQGCLLSFSSAAVLQRLDRLEGYDPHGLAATNEYVRQPIRVRTPDHLPLGTAWIYLMTPAQVSARAGVPLPSGHWPLPDLPQC